MYIDNAKIVLLTIFSHRNDHNITSYKTLKKTFALREEPYLPITCSEREGRIDQKTRFPQILYPHSNHPRRYQNSRKAYSISQYGS